jgi:hypothetical protein
MEELFLDERAFLCGSKFGSDGSGFIRVGWVNPNFICISHRIESLIWPGLTYIGKYVMIYVAFEPSIFGCHAEGLSHLVELLVACI